MLGGCRRGGESGTDLELLVLLLLLSVLPLGCARVVERWLVSSAHGTVGSKARERWKRAGGKGKKKRGVKENSYNPSASSFSLYKFTLRARGGIRV